MVELEPAILEEYLCSLLQFLIEVSRTTMFVYLPEQAKASLEMNLVSIMTVSSLKMQGSAFSPEIRSMITEVAHNLIAGKGVQDQAQSPLLFHIIKTR